MEITLEKIELVKDRTGVTYAEAKKALEDADGSVVDAIIAIEETINTGAQVRGFGERGEALFESLKKLVKKGNVARIQVKRDGETVLNVPVNAGIVGICIAPLASVVAIVAAFGFKCVIEVVKTDGTIIDVSDAVTDKVSQAAEFGSDKFEDLKGKSKEYYEKAKESDFAGKAKETAEDLMGKGKEYFEKAMDTDLAGKAREAAEDLKDKAEDLKEKVDIDVKEVIEEVEDAADDLEAEIKEELDKDE
ncbi:MAG: DUF4342 domain-containing protein [Bacillota bacterium]|nr:DUF4342 domain-containing protein [Bacillota bacterium]